MSVEAGDSAAILQPLLGLGVRLDLGPFRALLAALGEPQRAAPALLVAGTNGKGSVAVLADAALRAAGYRTALATSPHLARPHERVRLDGAEVAERQLAALLRRIVAAAPAAQPPTYFEALVAAALLAGAEAGVDAFVLEVGLGGRLDATNACDPCVSVITRIALDHRAELGDSLAAIAREKAGVLRPGRPAVIAEQEEEAARALADAARAVGALPRWVASSVRVTRQRARGLDGHDLVFETDGGRYALDLPLAGAHQVANARTAVAACEELARAGFPALDAVAIARGFARTRWPGRLEAFSPSRGGATVLLDAAHNPDGCVALGRFLAELGRRFILVFGALADKEASEMLGAVAPAAEVVVVTRPASPRALDPASLARERHALVVEDPDEALALALVLAAERRVDLVVVAGSIYLIGPLRARLVG